ncbi:hypothetical protein [Bacillus sp. MBGLi79]|uniref:hypothetical protein n=1 Tax=Bacillus TaxID=1386 RepID=UPI000CDA23F1|nr:hypothetical protein [Bacillus sp. MBGLi79]AUZ40914.1 hypothetical protein C1T29_22835 [Bacillus sp. MBGLi79]POO82355.1 hypothetical protein C1T30_11895 [Bacillus sp. MBGLi97]
MYETIRVGDWLIKADVEETRKQYEKDIKDMCECGNCLNYYEAVNELPIQKDQVLEISVSFRHIQICIGCNPACMIQ